MENSSHSEIAWVELSDSVLNELRKYAMYMLAMSPDEVRTYVAACTEAIQLAKEAATFDREIELLNNRVTYGNGGP